MINRTVCRIIFFILLIVAFVNVNAMGAARVDKFYLDSSLQKYRVFIGVPKSDRLQEFIKCTPSAGYSPIVITGMERGYYICTQTSSLDLKPNQYYLVTQSITITVNGQELTINNLDYMFDPWSEGKQYGGIFLLYLDEYGWLKYRNV